MGMTSEQIARLSQLADLKRKCVLTYDEFNAQKAELLAEGADGGDEQTAMKALWDEVARKHGKYYMKEFQNNTTLEPAEVLEIAHVDGQWTFRGAPTGVAHGDHNQPAKPGLQSCGKDGTHGYGAQQAQAVEIVIRAKAAEEKAARELGGAPTAARDAGPGGRGGGGKGGWGRGGGGKGGWRRDEELAVMKQLAEQNAQILAGQQQILAGVNAVRKLSESHVDELRTTRRAMRNAIGALEMKTPTAFVVLREKLPTAGAPAEEDEATLTRRAEEGRSWLKFYAECAAGVGDRSAKAIADAVTGSPVVDAVGDFLVGEEMWFYLVDEITGRPVVPSNAESRYPIRITKPAETVTKLLPVMQVGLQAATLVNGVSGVVRLFGYPSPQVPDEYVRGAGHWVDMMKQESSVEQFGAIQEKVEAGDEVTETVCGAALRELEAFFAEHDAKEDYAGLHKVWEDDDGTAVWTALPDEEVNAALETRAAERREEAKARSPAATGSGVAAVRAVGGGS